MLDVNVGLPSIDQERAMAEAVAAVEGASDLPLSIDSDSISIIESGLRAAGGIPLINSFTAREDSLFPGLALAGRHGASAAVLPIDEEGLPETAEARIAVVRKILAAADSAGFPRNGLVIDGLTLAAGADMGAARSTLEVLAFLREGGITSMLGVSNISHGMPARGLLNRTFLAMAVASGLSAAIMDPTDQWMMESAAASEFLTGLDPRGGKFISAAKNFMTSRPHQAAEAITAAAVKEEGLLLPEGPYRLLGEAILEGDGFKAESEADRILKNSSPLSLVNEGVIPALEVVGRKYDEGKFFLPQLISSAAAAEKACGKAMELVSAAGDEPRGKILLATVEGDLHDLGKNVLATILRSHGYMVTDLGKDVPSGRILAETEKGGYNMVGLSALMTSTMKTMAATVAELRHAPRGICPCWGSVSGAFAKSIGAHGFARMRLARCGWWNPSSRKKRQRRSVLMFIRDILGQTRPAISFEIFPPKPETPLESIFDTIGALKNLNPDFISVTYGAGGSSRDRTTDIASAVQNRWGLTSLAHLTCFGSTPPEVEEVVEVLEQEGVKNILPPGGPQAGERGKRRAFQVRIGPH